MLGDTFSAYFLALLTAHMVGDHWPQTHHQALRKGDRSRAGSWACFKHVVTYTIGTTAAGILVWTVLDLQITVFAFVIGQLISAVTHYWADRRFTLAWLAKLLGKEEFYVMGSPREGRDDNPSPVTGAYLLDQSFHWAWLMVAALVTTRLSAGGLS